MFTYILAFENFTGGGGDGDENPDDDAEALFTFKIGNARKNSAAVGGLSWETYQKWEKKGWYKLFHSR